MQAYLNLCRDILNYGKKKIDRTKTGTRSIFGYQMRFNLEKGFPLLTTKKMNFKAIIHELLWFIKGDTNIRYLVQNNVNIWNEWPYQKYCNSNFFQNLTLQEFIDKIIIDEKFAKIHGDLGPIYGHQWRNFQGIDQLTDLISEIKKNPHSRRLILTAWDPTVIKDMLLPPCHVMIQCYVEKNKISMQLYQRSGDVFLGIPFNIASYSLLLIIIAQCTGLKPFEFIHTIGDAHIYNNHIEQIQKQIKRIPKKLPIMTLNPHIIDINQFTFNDFNLEKYESYGILKGVVAV
ncbi:Thymidylate synthase [Candidatus Phytoplasma mali]|uniref:Thymidylate synthase n=1 Tax=Phytoplasma mali (strain AT) TaxID=482235 RepID=TYSY_PHYMT|nr:thymidylate synthase [Candidatus Phytoplasma mali]B3QZX0.1 RecName: Full=Thymidylate synthase; Short=TS; Short=TSase [Candidatus Phytoplasma mali AT]CAP18507.1 Thymidylate synthase [Candidatus Phytoplasma mali]